jgi:transcriptional regulator with XRE-family HTH domain
MYPDHRQLQQARTALALTIAEAAEAVSVGRSRVSRVEAGVDADEGLISKLTALYESKGVKFGNEGQVKLDPSLQRVAGRQVN